MHSYGLMLAFAAFLLWGLVQIPIRIARAPGRVGVMVSMPVGIVCLLVILGAQGALVLHGASAMDWFYIAVSGLTQFSLGTYMYFEGVRRAGITTASPITRLTPILVVLASAVLALEPMRWPHVVAAAIIFIGGIFLARGAHEAHPPEGRRDVRIGMLYTAAATALWAAGALCVGRVSSAVPSSLILFYGLVIGAVAHWAVMAIAGKLKDLRLLTRRDVVCYSLQGLGSFGLGYWAYFESIKQINLNEATVISGCWPVIAVVAGLVVFREPMNAMKLVGIILFIVSAVVAGLASMM